MVEPDVWSKTNAGVMVGRTLVETRGGEVPIVVANFSCEPQKIKEEHSKKCNLTAVTRLVSAEKDLVRMQLEDADLQPVIEWLQQSTERPSWQEVSRLSPTCKSYWSQWDLIRLNNGLLERQWETPDGLVK
ncbi:hypothetical protein Pcinc_002151 [Petrolisthes cinctipes]|uniref:Uncharacterized protein n=1 Tax=Petrolisthes cinctipes TaxID=88211 RepID=A0AAE1GLX4_PETCI|nr:hypothetical protein Pcinc_002151 [Petrolisthes cinctipes]